MKIWDMASGREVHTLSGHSISVTSVSWSSDGKHIASGIWDAIIIWDASKGREVSTLSEHSNGVNSVSWSPNGKYIASGNWDATIKIWDIASGKGVYTRSEHSHRVNSVSWSPDGKYIVSGSNDKTVKIWDIASGREVCTLSGHSSHVNSVAWSPDGRHIASGSTDTIVKIWDTSDGRKVGALSGHSYDVNSVSWSSDGKHIASGSKDGIIKIWDAVGGREVCTLSGHSSHVNSVSWSSDGKHIASGSTDATVKIWDIANGSEVRTLSRHSYDVNSVSWSSDGKHIASGSKDGIIKIWDAVGGREVCTLSGHSSHVNSVSWSSDGKHIASGSTDATVKIWDAVSGREVYTLSGHSGAVECISWVFNGKYIASGSWDSTIRIWDVANDKNFHTLFGHSSCVYSVSWSPDGKHIASGGRDGTIKIWDVQSGALLSTTINGKDGEWLTYTPEGFFCGSEWATKNLVYIVDGMDIIGIDQVYDTYYRPDLVAAKIRGEDISSYASAVQLASLVRSGRAPAVSLSGIPAESSGRDMTFGVCVRNTGGGIGAVNLLLNGKAIRLSDGVASADGETVEFRHTVTLQNGSNTLEAFALNGAGLVESVRSSAEVVWRGATEKPDLYVLTAAVNRYRDKSLWLNFAVPDAQAVAEGFQKQQSGLYRSVHVFQLNDGDVTKENLAAEFSRLSEQIRADDVFVFFVSGHGTTYDDGDYYYLPSDFRYTSKDSIPAGGISKNDLLTNLSKIKAGKTLVMLDTCNSGAFVSDIGQRGLSEKTAIDRLTRATGHATLAASSDTQAAMEGYNGHGVFTYVFLEGIAGAADSDGDGYVTLNELSAFVEREVPERSYEKWGYEQVPQKDLRRQDFPIAGK
ncbi:MAG: caspase family protein [Treponemataceae bacterium]|nr:caspase family protein [Treponemataceae bacterium]